MTTEERLDAIEEQLEAVRQTQTAHAAETLTWLTIEEAAAYLRVSDRTIRRALAAGDVKAYRVGGRRDLRFRREDLDAYLLPA